MVYHLHRSNPVVHYGKEFLRVLQQFVTIEEGAISAGISIPYIVWFLSIPRIFVGSCIYIVHLPFRTVIIEITEAVYRYLVLDYSHWIYNQSVSIQLELMEMLYAQVRKNPLV